MDKTKVDLSLRRRDPANEEEEQGLPQTQGPEGWARRAWASLRLPIYGRSLVAAFVIFAVWETAKHLLMMDEPSMGLAPKVVDDIYERLRPGAPLREGRTIVLAEQSATLGLAVADDAWVLEKGQVVAAGTPESLARSGAIAHAYLGVVSTNGAGASENA